MKRAQQNKNKTKVKEELWPNSSHWQGHHSPHKLHMMAMRAQQQPHLQLTGLVVFFANALATLRHRHLLDGTFYPCFICYAFALTFIQVVNKINFLASEYIILGIRDCEAQFKGKEWSKKKKCEIWQMEFLIFITIYDCLQGVNVLKDVSFCCHRFKSTVKKTKYVCSVDFIRIVIIINCVCVCISRGLKGDKTHNL